MTDAKAAEQLREWAAERFGNLTPAEARLLKKAPTGDECDVSSGDEAKDDPATADDWDDDRVVRAELIRWLCVDQDASKLVDIKGIQLQGARIDGELDLEDAKISFGLHFWKCRISEPMTLLGAEVWRVNLDGSHTASINLAGAIVRQSVFLSAGFTAQGEVGIVGASIGGDLSCTGGTLKNKGGKALSADRMMVRGGVYLREGFTAQGEVRLIGASIGGNLDCAGGTFENEGGRALTADAMTVKGAVFLNNFTAHGEVRLLSASIGATLECDGGTFENEEGDALSASGATVDGSVYLRNKFKARGEVNLQGASIGGDLECEQGTFEHESGDALSADGMTVKGSVYLRAGFTARGEVNLVGASIGGNLDCDGGTFENKGRIALFADGMTVEGGVFLRNDFAAQGEVRLPGASIGGDLDCSAGTFENKGGKALNAEGMTVRGFFFLRDGFYVSGRVDLIGASVGMLVDDKDAWPESSRNKLSLDGFQYSAISATAPTDAAFRIRWLGLQDQEIRGFLPKPYEQLAKVLREMGHPSDAKTVMIAKEEARRRYGKATGWPKRWHWLIGKTIGYGYRTQLAAIYLVVFLLLGGLVFSVGSSAGLMQPTDAKGVEDVGFLETVASGEGTPSLIPMWYSLDALVPIVDLHQQRFWLPMARDNDWGYALRAYLWLHIAAGWFFSTMVVIGVTGIARPG